MTKLSDYAILNFINQNKSSINAGNNLYLLRLKKVLVWRYRIKFKLNTRIIHSWKSLGYYPNISIQAARIMAQEIRKLIDNGINPNTYLSVKENSGKTFGELEKLYFEHHVRGLKLNSIRAWQVIMKNAQALHNVKAAAITENDIKDLIYECDKTGKSISAGLVQRIKQMFNWAKQRGYIPKNQLKELECPYKVGVIERYLDEDDIREFFGQLFKDKQVKPQLKVALYSLLILLLRKNELLNIRWTDVNFETGRCVIHQSKAINDWVIKLPRQINELWQELKQLNIDDEYIFSLGKNKRYSDTALSKQLAVLISKYHTKKWTPHDLRRTGMTLLSEQGQRYEVINAALGHVVKGVNRHYMKSNLLEERTKLLQWWVDYIEPKLA